MIHGTEEQKQEAEALKSTNENKTAEKTDLSQSKAEGVANDIVAGIEPFMRAGEKLFGLDRSAVGMKLVGGLISGKFDANGLFGRNEKKTRMQRLVTTAEYTIYILFIAMVFFWFNYAMWRWLR